MSIDKHLYWINYIEICCSLHYRDFNQIVVYCGYISIFLGQILNVECKKKGERYCSALKPGGFRFTILWILESLPSVSHRLDQTANRYSFFSAVLQFIQACHHDQRLTGKLFYQISIPDNYSQSWDLGIKPVRLKYIKN